MAKKSTGRSEKAKARQRRAKEASRIDKTGVGKPVKDISEKDKPEKSKSEKNKIRTNKSRSESGKKDNIRYLHPKIQDAVFEYDDDEKTEEELRKIKLPKAIYWIVVALLVSVVGLTLWVNRENLTPDNVGSWVKMKIMGAGIGDGFPSPIKGNHVDKNNFSSYDGKIISVSDTALTVQNASAKQLYSVRHSFDNPVFKGEASNFLIYNLGGKGYLMQSGDSTKVSGTLKENILAGAVQNTGAYALAKDSEENASELNVYTKEGKLRYNYLFVENYITSIAMAPKESKGVVTSVGSIKGVMTSKLTLLDFAQSDALDEYISSGNMMIDTLWSNHGKIYAVGDKSFIMGSDSDFKVEEYNFGGEKLTTYALENNRAFLAISGHAYFGESKLLIFQDDIEPISIEVDGRIDCISSYGSNVAVVVGSEIILFDHQTGEELARVKCGKDVKSIALAKENLAYVLGINEIRTVSIQ